MARPLRILVPGGWYHVTSRGNRRGKLFLDDTDRRRFLGLAAELPDRFLLELHAFVLMDNHYHLVVRTPEPNLSHAIRWLNVTYGSRFNWSHRLSGHVFQGRFNAKVIQDEAGVTEVARYLHLNPVRIGGLGLGKADLQQARVTGCEDPGAELVARRLTRLREYPWSSWRVYSGAEPAPDWLETGVISEGCGGRSRAERRAALVKYTEDPVRQGSMESPWDRLIGGLVLGDADFAEKLFKLSKSNPEEQTSTRRLKRSSRVAWKDIVAAAETVSGRKWDEMATKYGEWGRDGTMHVAVRFAGWRLAEVVRELPGLKYQAAAQGIRRFRLGAETDPEKRQFAENLARQLSTI